MKTIKILVILLIIFFVSVIGATIVVFATGYPNDFENYREVINYEESKNIGGITHIDIDMSTGKLKVIPTDDEEMLITFKGEKITLQNKKNFSIDVRVEDETLKVIARTSHKGFQLFHWLRHAELVVHIPKTFDNNLTVTFSTGDVVVRDLTLDQFTFNGSTGDVDLLNLSVNDAIVNFSTGDIEATFKSGDVKMSLSTGEIDFVHLGQDFDINISVKTGELSIKLPVDASFDIDAEVNVGSIAYDLPVSRTGTVGSKVVGHVGESGMNQVKLRVKTGEIEIERK